jgi:hypothetical protein
MEEVGQPTELKQTAFPERTFKLLKVTNHNGVVNYKPVNSATLSYEKQHQVSLSKEKRAKYDYKIVELTVEEAAELGVSEAYALLHPAKKITQQNISEAFVQTMANNNALMAEFMEFVKNKK